MCLKSIKLQYLFPFCIKVCSNHSKKGKIYSVPIIVPVISILITSTNLLQFDSMLPRIKEQKNDESILAANVPSQYLFKIRATGFRHPGLNSRHRHLT